MQFCIFYFRTLHAYITTNHPKTERQFFFLFLFRLNNKHTIIMKALELFGQNLKKLRKSRDLTQEQLGEQLNLSRNQINNYKDAMFELSIETLLQISSFFNVSLDLLCNGYSNTNDVLLRNTLEEVQQTHAALEEPKRKRFHK